MSDLDELVRLSPPQGGGLTVAADLPADYLELLGRYGDTAFAGVALLIPGHENQYLDMDRQTPRQRSALRTLAGAPYDPDDLLPWGIDEAGNVLWWNTAQDWRVVANEARGPYWQAFEGDVVDTLVGLISGRITSDFLVVG